MSQTVRTLLGALLVAMVVLPFSTFASRADSYQTTYPGALGDNINERTGELTLDHTDVSIAGRRGLNLDIFRHYSSATYTVPNLESADDININVQILDVSKYAYLGEGWFLGFPYLYRHQIDGVYGEELVLQDGSAEAYYLAYPADTLQDTAYTTDSLGNRLYWVDSLGDTAFLYDSLYTKYPYKTESLALLTGFGVQSNVSDTMLLSGGTKWIFGHRTTNKKFVTQIINAFQDTLTVEYHGQSEWIKKVTGPAGRWVKFQYRNSSDTIGTDNAPNGDNIRLYRLRYLNHENDTLAVTYHYNSSWCLSEVTYPSGNSDKYEYTNRVYYRTAPDWDVDNINLYNNTTYYDGQCYFLSKITNPEGAEVLFKYRAIKIPQYDYESCRWDDSCLSTVLGCNTYFNMDSIDSRWSYNQYIAVNKRIADGDTLLFKYQMVLATLWRLQATDSYDLAPSTVGSRTTLVHPYGAEERLYFHYDLSCSARPASFVGAREGSGGWPGMLFQRQDIVPSVNDSTVDTLCSTFSYSYDLQSGYRPCDSNDYPPYGCQGYTSYDTIGYYTDSLGIMRYAFRMGRVVSHSGTSFFNPDTSYEATDIIEVDTLGGWYSPFFKPVSTKRHDVSEFSMAHSYDLVMSTNAGKEQVSSTNPEWEYKYYWSYTDSIYYSNNQVVSWRYVQELNLVLVNKRSFWNNTGDTTLHMYTEYTYDTTQFYQLIEEKSYCSSSTIHDTLITRRHYNSNGLLDTLIGPYGDAKYYEYYDTTFLLKKEIDSFADSALTDAQYEYYPNGQLKKTTNLYGISTEYVYDFCGRDSLVFSPLGADTVWATTLSNPDSMWTSGSAKISDSLATYSRSYYDEDLRTVRNMLKVDDSTDQYIVDSTVYGPLGLVEKSMRARYNNDTTSDTVWTHYFYDASTALYKTVYPDSTADSVKVIGEFTTRYFSSRGNTKTITKDYIGNTTSVSFTDTSGDSIGTVTMEYKAGRLSQVTDLEGRSRQFEYDVYGRRTQVIDPDVGTVRGWYNCRGQVRFVRYNTDSIYTYMKYDSDNRLIQYGTVKNPITDSVEIAGYPITDTVITAIFRYDTYSDSDSTRASDTVGGLGYSLGRVTEITDKNGYTLLYYNWRGQTGLQTVYINEYGAKKIRYEYYDNGQAKAITYPDGNQAVYDIDMASRLTDITYPYECSSGTTVDTLVGDIKYDAWGPATSWEFHNGLKSRRRYDEMSRLDLTRNFVSASQNLYSRKYTYTDGFISLEQITDTAGNNPSPTLDRHYGYDARGRLLADTLSDPLGLATVEQGNFEYDNNGNLNEHNSLKFGDISYHRFAGTNCDSAVIFGTDSSWFFVKDSRGRIVRKTSYPDDTPSDTTQWKTREFYTYDYRNLMTEARDTLRYELWSTTTGWSWVKHQVQSYYDAAGQRVKTTKTNTTYLRLTSQWRRTTSVSNNYYVWSGGKVVYEKIGSNETRNHIYGLGEKLASAYINSNGGWGSVGGGGMMMMMMDPGGDTTGTSTDPGEDPPGGEDTCYTQMTYYVNDQYGSVRVGMSETSVLARIEYYPYGEVYSMSGGGSVYTFLGKEDPGVGMLDFGPRYYNAVLGRFMSPDPILAGASAYSYAEGNPIMMYDPSGMRPTWTRKRWTKEDIEQSLRDLRAGIAKARDMAEHEQEEYYYDLARQNGCVNPDAGIGNIYLPGETLEGTFEHIDPSENVTVLHDYSWHRPPDGDDSTPSQMIASGDGGCLAEIPVPGVHDTGHTITVRSKPRRGDSFVSQSWDYYRLEGFSLSAGFDPGGELSLGAAYGFGTLVATTGAHVKMAETENQFHAISFGLQARVSTSSNTVAWAKISLFPLGWQTGVDVGVVATQGGALTVYGNAEPMYLLVGIWTEWWYDGYPGTITYSH